MKEAYKPTPEEQTEAYSQMTLEQKEDSAVRQIFLESDHRIAELPLDLKYDLYRPHRVTGNFGGSFSGTFDGKILEISRFGKYINRKEYVGKIGNQDISEEKAKDLWSKIYPAIESFDTMMKSQKEALGDLRQDQEKKEAVKLELNRNELDMARGKALDEGERIGNVKSVLMQRLENFFANKEEYHGGEIELDKEFIKKVINKIALICTYDESMEPDHKYSDLIKYEIKNGIIEVLRQLDLGYYQEDLWKGRVDDAKINNEDCKRRLEILMEIFCTGESQKWTAGLGTEYVHSEVYDTVLPDIILRKCYSKREIGTESELVVRLERNSRYQKKS